MKKLNIRSILSVIIFTSLLMLTFSILSIYFLSIRFNGFIGFDSIQSFVSIYGMLCISTLIILFSYLLYIEFSKLVEKILKPFVISILLSISVIPIINSQEKNLENYFIKHSYSNIDKLISQNNPSNSKMPEIYYQFLEDFKNIDKEKLKLYITSNFKMKLIPVKDDKILIISLIESTTNNKDVLSMIRDIKKDSYISIEEYNSFVNYFKNNRISKDDFNQELAYLGLLPKDDIM